MTAIVGVYCSDGVVIGTDSSATFTAGQTRTIEQPTDKLHITGGSVIVAGTGAVGMTQRFCQVVENAWSNKQFQGSPIEIGKLLSKNAQEDFVSTGAPKGKYGALVAFPCKKQPYLSEFEVEHFQPELKTESLWYVSMGSSQHITDPFLGLMRDVFWREGCPTVRQAVFSVTWALDHAVQLNPGGVNEPVRIAVLERSKGDLAARILDEVELDEHREAIQSAKESLRDFARKVGTDAADVIDLPEPD